MKTVFLTLAIVSLSISALYAQKSNAALKNQVAVTVEIEQNINGFLLHLPDTMKARKKYPLLIVLHGVGELSSDTNNLCNLAHHYIMQKIQQGKFPSSFIPWPKHPKSTFKFIVVAPQFKAWPNAEDVNAVVNYAIKAYSVDTNRIYVTGYSMGGGATLDYAAKYGNRVAAIVPCAPATKVSSAGVRLMSAISLPAWFFHNSCDPTVTVANTINYVNALRTANTKASIAMTIFSSASHNCWDSALTTKNKNGFTIFEWMLKHKRK